ncbi:MAG: hypothetical protein ACLTSZ_02440 [Lachnospiraceae bacterium]
MIFDANWHLPPYQPGSVREEAIRRERLGLEQYHRGYTCMTVRMNTLTAR